MDDFVYFSPDASVERYFESSLSAKVKVDFMGDAEWFIGMKFDWNLSSDGHMECRLSQEAYSNIISEAMGLTDAMVSPRLTPFRSGYPIDAIPPKDMTAVERAPLIAKLRSWCSMLNWLSLGTRLDITAAVSLLPSNQCSPSPGHLDAAKYIGKYVKATAAQGYLSPRGPTRNWELSSFSLSELKK